MVSPPIQVSAMVTGFPPELLRPKFRPGESPLQFVIRNHPDEWTRCVTRLKLSTAESTWLKEKGQPLGIGPLDKEVDRFVDLRMPSHGRTLMGLAELRDANKRSPYQAISTFEISEILWPRPGGAAAGEVARVLADDLKVTIVTLPATAAGPMDLNSLLQEVHGDLWWLLPGGTRLFTPTLFLQLQRIVMHLNSSPSCALYFDNRNSMIYRTSSLKNMISRGVRLSADVRQNARLLQHNGFELSGGDSEAPLCELEKQFGGSSPSAEFQDSPKLWWQFWK